MDDDEASAGADRRHETAARGLFRKRPRGSAETITVRVGRSMRGVRDSGLERSVEVLLGEVSHGFRGTAFDLRLNLGGRCSVVDDDAELVVVDEEPAGGSLSIRVERDGLNGEITDMTADDHPNETEKATLDGRCVLGAVLHTVQPKHVPSSCKAPETP